MVDPTLLTADTIRPISRKEYDRLIELGFFGHEERVELVEGVLVAMSPQGWEHAAVIEHLNTALARMIDADLAVRPGLPFAASDWSEPEPDLAIVRKNRQLRDHPSSVLLLIEVANTSLKYDRGAKLAMYAKAGVPEYWVIDVNTMTVEVYTEPKGKGFASKQVLRDGDTLRPSLVPGIAIAVSDLPR